MALPLSRELWVRERLLEPVLVPEVVLGVRRRDVRRGRGIERVELPRAVGDRRKCDQRISVGLLPGQQPPVAGEICVGQLETKDPLGAHRPESPVGEEARPVLAARPRLE
jgi:hypothetical protein